MLQPKYTGQLNGKKTRPKYILSPRDLSQIERYTQTKSKGMEKDGKENGKEKKKAGVAVLLSNKTKSLVINKKSTLHNDKENNPTRGYNPSKHLMHPTQEQLNM